MDDLQYKALIQKISKLEKHYEELDEKVTLLIHSVNALYEDIDMNDVDTNDDVEPEEDEMVEDKLKSVSIADLILAVAEELAKDKE